MAHDTDGWPIQVYRYGSPGWGGKRAITISDHGRDQMWRGHRLRNDLVTVAEQKDATMNTWWQTRLPDEYAALDAADAACDEAWAEVKRERVRQRRRDITGPATDAHRDATASRRTAAIALRTAKDTVKGDDGDAVKAMLLSTDTTAKAATKALYQQYAADGLYWASANAVIAHAKTAEKLVINARQKGHRAQRRYARWDGSGVIAVQLQRSAGDPRRTPELIGSGGGKWRNVLRIGPSEHGPRMRTITLSTGHGRPMVGIDVVWHRDIPPDADITSAELVATRIAGNTRYTVCITARVPPPAPVATGPTVALHLGWRAEKTGARVATWRSDTPLPVPDALTGAVTQDTPASGRVILPARIIERMATADQVRSSRDVALDEIRATLAGWLDTHPQPPIRDGAPPLTGALVRAWKSPDRFAAVALAWRDDPREGIDDIQPALEEWRRTDRIAWEREANGRAAAVGQRRDIYRQTAAWLARMAGRVLVDKTDLSAIQATPKTGELLPGTVEDRIAGRRADVSPGELRAAVKQAAIRDGVTVEIIPATGLTSVHHACGHKHPRGDARFLTAEVTCDGCGRTFDQDVNATIGMMARAAQWPSP